MATESQNGYSIINAKADTKNYKVKGSSTVLDLRDDEAGEILALFAADFHEKVESLNKTDCHGYNRRQISGSDEWSNHASGTAIDLNASKHEYGKTNTFTKTQVEAIDKLLTKYQGVVKAGKNYRGTKDEMHFEVDKPLAEVKKVLASLTKTNEPEKPKNRGTLNFDLLVAAAYGRRRYPEGVSRVQKALVEEGFGDFPATGNYAEQTTAAYAKFQRSLGFKGADADGKPGSTSLKKLGFKEE